MTISSKGLAALLLLGAAACAPDPCKSTGISIQTGEVMGSIAEAIDAAGPGGVVALCAGTYDGDILTLKDGMSLIGEGAEETAIELDAYEDSLGHMINDTFVVLGDERVTISDLTITGGGSEVGGAVSLSGSDLLLDRVRLLHNGATVGGALSVGDTGGVHASLTIRDSVIQENDAREAGALALWSAASVTVEDTNFGTTGREQNQPDDVALYASNPYVFEEPLAEPLATYDFEGTVSFTCEWETATCD